MGIHFVGTFPDSDMARGNNDNTDRCSFCSRRLAEHDEVLLGMDMATARKVPPLRVRLSDLASKRVLMPRGLLQLLVMSVSFLGHFVLVK